MNTKLLLTSLFSSLLLIAGTLQAQEYFPLKKNEPKSAFKTTWQKKSLKDAWFVSLGSGVQILSADNDGDADLTNRLTYAPSLTVGRYFSPIWGLRANFTGGSAHGFEDNAREMQHVHYFAANTSFMFDMFTLFGYYNPQSPFELTPFVGPSFYYVASNDGIPSSNGLALNAGIQAKVRLNSKVNFFLESNSMILPGRFDGDVTKNNDKVHQLIAGVTFKIGDSDWRACEPDYEHLRRMNDQVNALKKKIDDLSNRKCPDCPELPAEVRVKTPKIYPDKSRPEVVPLPSLPPAKVERIILPDPVFFRINKSIIDASELGRIELAVKYLADNPTANIEVTGYADKNTGSARRNLQLSKERSNAVAKMMQEKYGVDPARLTVNWKGDDVQPFIQNNDWNRAVIFVVRPQ